MTLHHTSTSQQSQAIDSEISLTFTPATGTTGTPASGGYRIVQGVGTDSEGQKFLAGGQTRQPQPPPQTLAYQQEWGDSGAHPDLVALNVWAPSPQDAIEFILGDALDGQRLNNPAQVSASARRLLDRYAHLEQGGWACEGVDPATGHKMGWGCFKPVNPRTVTAAKGFGPEARTETKTVKYEAPLGVGKRIYCLSVSWRLGLKIATNAGLEQDYQDRMGDTDPTSEDGGFWPWAIGVGFPQLQVTEGAKKAAYLLSQGYLAIAVDGVENWSEPRQDKTDRTEARQLKADIKAVIANIPDIVIVYDQDTKPSTVTNVTRATQSFAHALEREGCTVAIALWNPGLGKGIDDIRDSEQVAYILAHTFPWQNLKQVRRYFGIPEADITLTTDSLKGVQLPKGDIALRAPKGSGKTVWASEETKDSPKVIALNFRVSLCEDQATRLELEFLNDCKCTPLVLIDAQGNPTDGGRLTLNVDSILKLRARILRGDYDGATIILDELEQFIRHTLNGSTVRKGGRLPLILDTLGELLRRSGRAIALDADLSQGTIDWLNALTARKATVVVNLATGVGYQWRKFTTRKGILARLKKAALDGKRLFITTTTKRETKRLQKTFEAIGLKDKVFVRNSETSGQTRDYSANPTLWLLNHPEIQIVICSPTDATGISIEAVDRFDIVAMIGLSGAQTDADLSQMLSRVREKVERWIWTSNRGGRYSPVSRSTNPLEVKSALQRQTDTASQVLNHTLTLEHDAHLEAWATLEARTNFAMQNLGQLFETRMHLEGNRLIETLDLDGAEIADELRAISEAVKLEEHTKVLNAERIDEIKAKALDRKDVLSPEETAALKRFKLCQFYRIPPEALTLEDIKADQDGRLRGQVLNFEHYLNPDLARTADLDAIKAGHHLIERKHCHLADSEFLRSIPHLADFTDPSSAGEWDTDDPRLEAIKAYVVANLERAKDAGIHIRPDASPQAVLGTIQDKLGLQSKRIGKPKVKADGAKIYRYTLDGEKAARMESILDRRGHTPPVSPEVNEAKGGCDLYPIVSWEGEDWYKKALDGWVYLCPVGADPVDPRHWIYISPQDFAA